MATVTKPMALDESLNTTETNPRNIADVLAEELGRIVDVVKPDAEDVDYNNTASGLTATNVQDAIDEIEEDISDIQDKIDVSLESVSGNPISIADLKSSQLAVNPVITYNPIQDLHGQSKPYPAGGGKNLIPLTLSAIQTASVNSTPTGSWSGNTWNSGVGITIEVLCDSANNVSGLKVNGTATSNIIFLLASNMSMQNQQYTLSGCPSGGSAETYRMDARNMATSIMIDDGNGVTFNSAERNDGHVVIRVGSGTQVSNAIFKPQLESGSTKTAFAPYSNICPISGYDKIEVLSCGRNLFDISKVAITSAVSVSGTTITKGETAYNYDLWTGSTGQLTASAKKLFLKAGTYVISFTSTASNTIIWVDGIDEVTLQPKFNINTNLSSGTTFTVPTASWVCLKITQGVGTWSNIQIEEASTPTTYVPYHKTTDLSESLGQTVYGGLLDVRSGIFTKIWGYIASYAGETLPSEWISDRDEYVSGTTPTTGAEVAYKLANANYTTIQLTPHEIILLKDYAYVSTNGTSIALDYHNGELASLADVSQLGETVNELGEYVGKNNAGSVIDISSYTSTNKYVCPCDGYVQLYSGNASSGYMRVIINGANDEVMAYLYMNVVAAYTSNAVFVKKGMKVYVNGNTVTSSGAVITFNPIR